MSAVKHWPDAATLFQVYEIDNGSCDGKGQTGVCDTGHNLLPGHVMHFDLATADAVQLGNLKRFFNAFGFVVFKPAFASQLDLESFCRNMIVSTYNDAVGGNGFERACATIDTEDDYKEITGDLSTEALRTKWAPKYMHHLTGCPLTGKSFNNPYAWKLRTDEDVVAVANDLLDMGENDTAVPSIDSMYAVLQRTTKDNATAHIDVSLETANAIAKGYIKVPCIQGKFVASPGGDTFLCRPGSHKMGADMYNNYQQLQKDSSGERTRCRHGRFCCKFFSGPGDTLNLANCTTVHVPQGHFVFWHPCLVHGQEMRHSKKRYKFGAYIGFQREVNRVHYTRLAGTTEVCDRFETWQTGKKPRVFSSQKAKVKDLPQKYYNDPKHFQPWLQQMHGSGDANWNRYTYTHKKRKFDLVEWTPDASYEPYALTSRREKILLVGKEYVSLYFQE